jgi:hypothetical protein
MAEVPSRAGLAALAAEAGRIAPVALFGFVQQPDAVRASIFYCYSHGIAQCAVPARDVPDVLRPTGDDLRDAGQTAIAAGLDGSVEWFLRFAGARRLVSVPIADRVPATRFWIASENPEAFTRDARAPRKT